VAWLRFKPRRSSNHILSLTIGGILKDYWKLTQKAPFEGRELIQQWTFADLTSS
jgi:hypothetical protein